MAEETVDRAVLTCGLHQERASITKDILIDGATDWTPTFFIRLIQDFGLDTEVRSDG